MRPLTKNQEAIVAILLNERKLRQWRGPIDGRSLRGLEIRGLAIYIKLCNCRWPTQCGLEGWTHVDNLSPNVKLKLGI
jgi:hypothetical protein